MSDLSKNIKNNTQQTANANSINFRLFRYPQVITRSNYIRGLKVNINNDKNNPFIQLNC